MTASGHGTLYYRKRNRCGCEPCLQADRDYTNTRVRLMAYGQWQPLVDAEPVRDHVRQLVEQGVPKARIAELSGVPYDSLSRLLGERSDDPMPKRLKPENAERLLSVAAKDHFQGAALVNARGGQRRLQALMAVGWPMTFVAPRVGITPEHSRVILRGERKYLTRATHNAIRQAYKDMWRQSPTAYGVSKKSATLTQRMAAERGWAGPLHWNDESIDDPAGFPDWTGHCGTASGWALHLAGGEDPCEPCTAARPDFTRRRKVQAVISDCMPALDALATDEWTWERIGRLFQVSDSRLRQLYLEHKTRNGMGVAA